MHSRRPGRTSVLVLLGVALATGLFSTSACGEEESDAPSAETSTITFQITTEESPGSATNAAAPTAGSEGGITLDASSATVFVDGSSSDWESVEGISVTLKQFELQSGVTFNDLDWDEPHHLEAVDAILKVAVDADTIYLLLEIPDDYDYNPDDHNLTGSPSVMFLIDSDAGPHMGASDEDFETGLGMVDIWHWELDCGPGDVSGGGGIEGGDDPTCNLDDEYATDPEDREDDGDGEVANAAGENSLAGVWEHTGRTDGPGADGTWIFEMSRPLQTGDPQDAQFSSGAVARLALAYFDADETDTGWTETGHLQSSDLGWIAVTLP